VNSEHFEPEEPEASSLLVRRIGMVLGPVLFLALLSWSDGPLDELQRKTAAITALTATWWITAALPIGITSILPAALLPLLGVMGGRDVAPRYMHDLVFLFLGAFIIALGLQRWNVHKRIALWILSLVGSRPRNLVLGFMIASAFLSFWINNTSTTLLMLPIGVAVVVSVTGGRPSAKDPFAVALLLGIAYSASVGGMATPVGTAPNQVFLGQFQDRFPDAPAISFGQWMAAWVPLVILYVPLGWVVLCFVALKVPQGSPRGGDVIRSERKALGPMSRAEKLMAIVFATTACLWVTRSNLELGFLTIPGWARHVLPASIEAPEKFITDATVATFMAVLCFLIPVDRKRGVFLMDWQTAKKMPWEVLLLIGGGFAIAGAFQASGLDVVLGESLSGWMKGRSSWVVVAGIVAFMALLTEVTSNTATTAVLLPVLGQAAVAAGFSPLFTMVPATIAASAAFMLPVATPPNAVVFSSRLVPSPTMARVGIWVNLLLFVLVTLVFQLWAKGILRIDEGLPDWAN
jgi:sodium-dependent dicarboxylate transporter 2/3/5